MAFLIIQFYIIYELQCVLGKESAGFPLSSVVTFQKEFFFSEWLLSRATETSLLCYLNVSWLGYMNLYPFHNDICTN